MDYFEYYSALANNESEKYNFFYTRLNRMLLEWNKYICQIEYKTEFSWVYMFEYIKTAIINLISEFCPKEDKVILKKHLWDNEYKEVLFKTLLHYKKKSLIIWCFLQACYYLDEKLEKSEYYNGTLENMEFLISKGTIFDSVDELYLDPLLLISAPLFPMSYRNQNNKSLFEKRYDTYVSMCPDLIYDGVKDRQVRKEGKLKIGFMSDFLTKDSSVLRDRMGIIENLDRDKFDVKIIVSVKPDKIEGKISREFYERNKEHFVFLDLKISDSRKTISNLELDVLVYCEIGMAVKNFLLSFSRLAPIQINTWGHSDTSGNKDIDYFISSKLFEIDEAQENYSEKLVKFDSLGTYYFPPDEQYLSLDDYEKYDRKHFELPEDKFLIGCIQSKFKISIEFEYVLKEILENNKDCLIYLSIYTEINRSHLERIKLKLGDNFNRLKFIRGMKTQEYLYLLRNFDIILDPFPFGGCNTSLEAFRFNIPVVTQPTNFINGRFTSGFYELMNLKEMISETKDDYVKMITKLIDDKTYLDNIKSQINEKKNKLFKQKESIDEWSKFLLEFQK